MKRYTQSAFIVAVALAVGAILFSYFAARAAAPDPAGEPVRYRAMAAGSATAETDETAARTDRLSSAIELEPDETLLDLYSFNLDFDDEDEQVLVVRASDDPAGAMRVVVADYSPGTRRWARAWEGVTAATQVKTFQVAVNDLVGDHNLNIVCTGINERNEQTMTVFWKTLPESGEPGLWFAKVFEMAGNAVLIEDVERPAAYKLGQSNAESWTISVWRTDPSSGNFMDQVRETWTWNFAERRYVLAGEERIPGASIARRMAESVLDGKAETFERFLDGIWYKESVDPASPEALFVTFQSGEDNVLFSGAGIVEIYQWESSNPTKYGLYIACRNNSVRNLRRLLDVELSASDAISIRVFQDLRIKADVSGKWDGVYRKLAPEIARGFRRDPSSAELSPSSPAGRYLAADGTELRFAGSTYVLRDGGGLEEGGFGVYRLGDKLVMDMKALKRNGAASSARRSWLMATSTRSEEGGAPVDILTLTPVRIGIDGVESVESSPIEFEKTSAE